MDATVIVFRASLQYDDLFTLVGAEARGDNRAGSAGTHHHIVRNGDGAACRFIHFSISPCRDVLPAGKVLLGKENRLGILNPCNPRHRVPGPTRSP